MVKLLAEFACYVILCSFVFRFREYFSRRAVFNHLSVEEISGVVADPCRLLHVMRYNNDSNAFFQIKNKFLDL